MNHQCYGGSTQIDSGRAAISPVSILFFGWSRQSCTQTYGVFVVIFRLGSLLRSSLNFSNLLHPDIPILHESYVRQNNRFASDFERGVGRVVVRPGQLARAGSYDPAFTICRPALT